jgi:hypothetical protein
MKINRILHDPDGVVVHLNLQELKELGHGLLWSNGDGMSIDKKLNEDLCKQLEDILHLFKKEEGVNKT